MTGCWTCGGYGGHHDPIAHGAEPEPDEYDTTDTDDRDTPSEETQ